MARQLDIEQRLIAWADWKRTGAGSSAGGEPTAHADEWLWVGAQATDHCIAALPGKLPATLEEVYVRPGNMARHALRLGCPEHTLVRRIGRAHALLAAQLAERRDLGVLQRQRLLMKSWLDDADSSLC